jgi:hypothetical protein
MILLTGFCLASLIARRARLFLRVALLLGVLAGRRLRRLLLVVRLVRLLVSLLFWLLLAARLWFLLVVRLVLLLGGRRCSLLL